jgi:hypothetical protein
VVLVVGLIVWFFLSSLAFGSGEHSVLLGPAEPWGSSTLVAMSWEAYRGTVDRHPDMLGPGIAAAVPDALGYGINLSWPGKT